MARISLLGGLRGLRGLRDASEVTYQHAQQLLALQAAGDAPSLVSVMSTYSAADLAALIEMASAIGEPQEIDALRAVAAQLGANEEIIEVSGTAPVKNPKYRPWWHYALAVAGVGAVGFGAYKLHHRGGAALSGSRLSPGELVTYTGSAVGPGGSIRRGDRVRVVRVIGSAARIIPAHAPASSKAVMRESFRHSGAGVSADFLR